MKFLSRHYRHANVRIEVVETLPDDMEGDNIEYHGTHLWPSAVVLAAAIQKLGICENKKVLELGCGCALPGLVAAQDAMEVIFTDGFSSGMTSARKAIEVNCLQAKTSVKKLNWGKREDFEGIDVVLASDCLYPDVSSWNAFFYTVVNILEKTNNSKCLLAFHKRNTSTVLEPFLEYWGLGAIVHPLSDIGIDLEDDIGGTKLPGTNTGSIWIMELSLKYNSAI